MVVKQLKRLGKRNFYHALLITILETSKTLNDVLFFPSSTLLKAKRLQHDVIVHESRRGGSRDL
jgi:hypothetical protein